MERNTKGQFERIYDVDETFFEKIDTEEKAYTLGFFYADGCNSISTHERCISLTQLEQDKDILDKIKLAMKYTNPNYVVCVQKTNNKVKYTMSISRRKLSEDIAKLGVVPNKSLILSFPSKDIIPEELLNHFIRGYFDGDGCIWEGKPHVDKNNRFIHNVKFTFTGCISFIEPLQDCLVKLGIVNKKTKLNFSKANNPNTSTCDKVCTMEYSGKKQVEKFYHYLYDNATIFGNRKKSKFENIICANSKKLLFETRLNAEKPLES